VTDEFALKRISNTSIPAALQKAERYRIINDPSSAESICLDVLEVDPRNQEALVTLLLAITDQLPDRLGEGAKQAQALLPKLSDDYKQKYYAGIICERCGKAHLRRGAMGSGEVAYHWFREAILRWNTCARILARDEHIRPRVEEPVTPGSE
jgi:hypothetical protein